MTVLGLHNPLIDHLGASFWRLDLVQYETLFSYIQTDQYDVLFCTHKEMEYSSHTFIL